MMRYVDFGITLRLRTSNTNLSFFFGDPFSRQVSGEIFLSVTWVYPTIEGRGRAKALGNSACFLGLPIFFRNGKTVHVLQKDH